MNGSCCVCLSSPSRHRLAVHDTLQLWPRAMGRTRGCLFPTQGPKPWRRTHSALWVPAQLGLPTGFTLQCLSPTGLKTRMPVSWPRRGLAVGRAHLRHGQDCPGSHGLTPGYGKDPCRWSHLGDLEEVASSVGPNLAFTGSGFTRSASHRPGRVTGRGHHLQRGSPGAVSSPVSGGQAQNFLWVYSLQLNCCLVRFHLFNYLNKHSWLHGDGGPGRSHGAPPTAGPTLGLCSAHDSPGLWYFLSKGPMLSLALGSFAGWSCSLGHTVFRVADQFTFPLLSYM